MIAELLSVASLGLATWTFVREGHAHRRADRYLRALGRCWGRQRELEARESPAGADNRPVPALELETDGPDREPETW